MCIAVAIPEGQVIPFEHLEEGARANPDGCGIGWFEDGKLHTFTCMLFKDFTLKYEEIMMRLVSPQLLIHFRITSKGATTLENCHPFWVNEDNILIHNGTFSGIPKDLMVNGRSDTAVFAEDILSGLPDGWKENPSIIHLLEDYVGFSKVVILDSDQNFTFLNERGGFWVDGIWYSNKTYMRYIPYNKQTKNIEYDRWKEGNSDNYNEWGQYKKYNEEWCNICFKKFKYDELIWDNQDCICAKCFHKKSDTGGAFQPELLETAEELLKVAQEGRLFDDNAIIGISNCDCCAEEMFDFELYKVWIDSKDVMIQGRQELCEDCFKLMYISDDVDSIEIIS